MLSGVGMTLPPMSIKVLETYRLEAREQGAPYRQVAEGDRNLLRCYFVPSSIEFLRTNQNGRGLMNLSTW
jgi:hypothetical protein